MSLSIPIALPAAIYRAYEINFTLSCDTPVCGRCGIPLASPRMGVASPRDLESLSARSGSSTSKVLVLEGLSELQELMVCRPLSVKHSLSMPSRCLSDAKISLSLCKMKGSLCILHQAQDVSSLKSRMRQNAEKRQKARMEQELAKKQEEEQKELERQQKEDLRRCCMHLVVMRNIASADA